jgi:hypothetical protein
VGLPSRLIVRFGSMLLKNALPQITCCVGNVFSLFLAGCCRLVGGTSPGLPCHYAIDAHTRPVGGPSRRSAIVLRFCTMAAR